MCCPLYNISVSKEQLSLYVFRSENKLVHLYYFVGRDFLLFELLGQLVLGQGPQAFEQNS